MIGLAILSMGAAYSARAFLEIGPVATVTGTTPEIRFFDTTAGDADWEIETRDVFQIGIEGDVDEPFRILPNAPEDSLRITGNGLETHSGSFRFVTDSQDVVWDFSYDEDEFEINVLQSIGGCPISFTQPFEIDLEAPQESLRLSRFGLETRSGSFRFVQQIAGSGGQVVTWDINPDDEAFAIDVVQTASTGCPISFERPFQIDIDAPDNSLNMAANGDVMLGGTTNVEDPDSSLHVLRNNGTAQLKVEEGSNSVANRDLMELVNNGGVRFALDNLDRNERWEFSNNSVGDFNISRSGTGGPEVIVSRAGRLTSGPGGSPVFDSRPSGNLFIAGTLFESSDRDKKENFEDVDCEAVLQQIAELDITTWNYKSDDEEIRHMGPVAQDFRASFQLGDSDKTIATTDKVGVSLAAIKALNSKLQTEVQLKDGQIEGLENELDELKSRMNKLEAILEQAASRQ